MILAVHQPQFLPWLGYFDKMIRSDVFCYLDNVQYKKNEWQNRNRIKTRDGWQWLTVPVLYRFPEKIREVKINNRVNWKRKHLQALLTHYRKSPFFDEYIAIFEEIHAQDWDGLADLNIALMEKIRKKLDLDRKPALRASTLELSENPTGRLIDICRALDCDTYLAGEGGADYMDLEQFRKKNIRVIFQTFDHPLYPQLFGDFRSRMSIIDLLFNCGHESIHILRGEA